MAKKVLIVQRVLTGYRFELLQELAPSVEQLDFVTSQGETQGTLKRYKPKKIKPKNIKILTLNAFRFGYSGDSRNTSLFFYPQVLKLLKNYDTVVLEGTTNLLNNILIVPYAKILGKKILWWDAGYSLDKRTLKRKIIDNVVKIFIQLTDVQLAYSTKAKKYMQTYMGATNCHLLLNTINTAYFESIQDEIQENIRNYKYNPENIKLLYVGAIEERKKIKELIDIVMQANREGKKFTLTVIGGGSYLDFLKQYVLDNAVTCIDFTGPIYDKENLKKYYFNSDLFVLPGDGGLGLLQSLLYGLPAVCTAADGTEEDYMDNKMILKKIKNFTDLDFSKIHLLFDYNTLYMNVNAKNYIEKLKKLL